MPVKIVFKPLLQFVEPLHITQFQQRPDVGL
jgi:hypothetical protein